MKVSKNKNIILIFLLMINIFSVFGQDGQDSDSRFAGRKTANRTIAGREFSYRETVDREIIDRESIETEIYARYGEYIDGVYILGLQTQDYIDARIEIESQYDLDITKFIGNITIGTGIIVITAITIPALVPALAPQIGVIVTHIVQASLADAAIDAAVNGAITYLKTDGDANATINQALMGAAEGYKWGAIFASGAELSSVLIKTATATRFERHTRNYRLVGKVDPKTGVPFIEKTIFKDGKLVKGGVFPIFDSKFDFKLSENLWKATDDKQFSACTKALKEAIDKNTDLARRFTPDELKQISAGSLPDGYTWHHNEETGLMQLVDFQTHMQTGHTGGRSIWGGGADYR